MTLEEKRDALLKEVSDEKKDPKCREAYTDGVLDMYNAAKAVKKGK